MSLTIQDKVRPTDSELRKALYDAHRGRCFYTSQPMAFEEMQVDHLRPKTRGGKDCIENLVPTHARINIFKRHHVDPSSLERILYINRIAFAPRVLRRYLTIREKRAATTSPIDYLKVQESIKKFERAKRLHRIRAKRACKVCGHVWISRLLNKQPKQCPNHRCGSPYWKRGK